MSKNGKVLVAMSGGIDSSVTAMMLHEQGYEVIGITMKTWDYESSGSSKRETGCCSLDSINDARSMAVNFGFPHYILDIRGEFGEFIINNFVEEYLAGRTPNPCVLCNTHIKWDALLKRADMLDCEFIATGHYAQLRTENNRKVVFKGLDETKDQTYVLWGLNQDCLKRTMFPLGQYKKAEIKQMAKDAGFYDLANKSESYDICFVPDNDYRAFLNHRLPHLEKEVAGGSFIYKGKEVGKHKGYPYFTVGQRKGLDIALGVPVFVKEIIPEKNTVVLGDKEDLEENHLLVRDFNLIKYEHLPDDFVGLTKIRYKDAGALATINTIDSKLDVIFHSPVVGVAPGQSAVIYEGNDLVGGGFIDRKPIII
ncbi:MAG: tRNA 2-thiouridine(34) synthase MnmA [Bacteroidota bacterium]|jgi:tRNA-specific 2-thiouridylase|nr:tRNA 2-thiouridine(34) synthase MnmA [Bacteroidota bacterium]MCA6442951.1 tRNA 2-thiouridine(34) synthase MnmA [Bacteroidota bacterium]